MLPLGGFHAGDRCHDRNVLKQQKKHHNNKWEYLLKQYCVTTFRLRLLRFTYWKTLINCRCNLMCLTLVYIYRITKALELIRNYLFNYFCWKSEKQAILGLRGKQRFPCWIHRPILHFVEVSPQKLCIVDIKNYL
jgi:hypothetical protein